MPPPGYRYVHELTLGVDPAMIFDVPSAQIVVVMRVGALERGNIPSVLLLLLLMFPRLERSKASTTANVALILRMLNRRERSHHRRRRIHGMVQ